MSATNLTREEIQRLLPYGRRTKVVFDMIQYVPTEGQNPILLAPESELLVAGGFQAGKSVLGSKVFIKRFFDDLPRVGPKDPAAVALLANWQ